MDTQRKGDKSKIDDELTYLTLLELSRMEKLRGSHRFPFPLVFSLLHISRGEDDAEWPEHTSLVGRGKGEQ